MSLCQGIAKWCGDWYQNIFPSLLFLNMQSNLHLHFRDRMHQKGVVTFWTTCSCSGQCQVAEHVTQFQSLSLIINLNSIRTNLNSSIEVSKIALHIIWSNLCSFQQIVNFMKNPTKKKRKRKLQPCIKKSLTTTLNRVVRCTNHF